VQLSWVGGPSIPAKPRLAFSVTDTQSSRGAKKPATFNLYLADGRGPGWLFHFSQPSNFTTILLPSKNREGTGLKPSHPHSMKHWPFPTQLHFGSLISNSEETQEAAEQRCQSPSMAGGRIPYSLEVAMEHRCPDAVNQTKAWSSTGWQIEDRGEPDPTHHLGWVSSFPWSSGQLYHT
jgi:hypothetical protein